MEFAGEGYDSLSGLGGRSGMLLLCFLFSYCCTQIRLQGALEDICTLVSLADL